MYVHDEAGRAVAEYDSAGNLLRRLLHDPSDVAPVAVVPPEGAGSALYHYTDRLGTPVIVADGSGALDVAETDYLPYGEGSTPRATGFCYAGYRWEAESGLYHVGARDYDPAQGRFIQPDPIGTAGGDQPLRIRPLRICRK